MRFAAIFLLLLLIEISNANDAILSGVIGKSTEKLSQMNWFIPRESRGGCRWYGTAPFCNGECPYGYHQMKESNGRSSNWWMAGYDIPDDSFGHSCTTILGGFFKKRYCCIADPSDCTWSGIWQNTSSAATYSCSFKAEKSRCGQLECMINTFLENGVYPVNISGDECEDVEMFGNTGKATCGYIEWHKKNDDQSKSPVHSWYKVK